MKIRSYFMAIIFTFFFASANAQNNSLTFTDTGDGVLTLSDDEQQGSSSASYSSSDPYDLENFSITVFSDLTPAGGSAALRQAIEDVLGVKFSTEADPKGNVFIHDHPYFVLRIDGATILITISERPMEFKESDISWIFSSPDKQLAFDSHTAYTHIEMVQFPYGYDSQKAYQVLGKLAGILTPDPKFLESDQFIRGYIARPVNRSAIYNPSSVSALMSDTPLDLFKEVPKTTQAAPSKPQRPALPPNTITYEDAKKIAQDSFRKFERKAAEKKYKVEYRVLAEVSTRQSSDIENLWFEYKSSAGKNVDGVLLGDPTILEGLSRGDEITITKDKILNWMILDKDDSENNETAIDPTLKIVTLN